MTKQTDPNVAKFTSVLKEYWIHPNYPLLMRQANSIIKEYKLNYSKLRMILKYAIEYEKEIPNDSLGIGLYQYFPKYIQPCQEFEESILNSRDSEIEEDETITIKRRKYKPKDVEF